jgi:hypothetical protein
MRVDSSTLTTQIFPRANAAAMSSRQAFQALGTRLNSFAGKMALDQVNGVISGQMTSLITTGKFQSFKEMLTDPSTYIGFATSAATTKGGGPTRANTGGAEPVAPRANISEPVAPRANVDVNAPRANVEVNAPRANVEPTAPRATAPEVTAPRTNVETPAPRATAEPTAPRTNVETPTAPRADVDAPKTNTTETVKASRFERFQNSIENIQGRFTRAGERVGQTAGVGVMGNKARIPTVENPTLKPGEQRVVTNDGQTRIEVAPGTKDTFTGKADIETHRQTAIDDIRGGRKSDRATELNAEAIKHNAMADWREQLAAKPDTDPAARRMLLDEAAQLRDQANDFREQAKTADTTKGSGTGEIRGKSEISDPQQMARDYEATLKDNPELQQKLSDADKITDPAERQNKLREVEGQLREVTDFLQ